MIKAVVRCVNGRALDCGLMTGVDVGRWKARRKAPVESVDPELFEKWVSRSKQGVSQPTAFDAVG